MRPFSLNGDIWVPVPVDEADPRLIDRTGTLRVATTDPSTRRVYLSRALRGESLRTVMLHEVGHCALHSYGLLESLHRVVPERDWVAVEEWVCNYLADQGAEIMHAAGVALGAPAGKGCRGASCLT